MAARPGWKGEEGGAGDDGEMAMGEVDTLAAAVGDAAIGWYGDGDVDFPDLVVTICIGDEGEMYC